MARQPRRRRPWGRSSMRSHGIPRARHVPECRARPPQGLSVQAGNGGGRPPPGGGDDARPRRRSTPRWQKASYDASTLSQRHRMWGRGAEQGYLALLVDGFGPRAIRRSFPRSSRLRPGEIQRGNHSSARRLWRARLFAITAGRGHGSGRAARLVERRQCDDGGDVDRRTRHQGADAGERLSRRARLLPSYPLKGQVDNGCRPYAPVRIFMGTADEVSPQRCAALVGKPRTEGPTSKFVSTRVPPTGSTTRAGAAKT